MRRWHYHHVAASHQSTGCTGCKNPISLYGSPNTTVPYTLHSRSLLLLPYTAYVRRDQKKKVVYRAHTYRRTCILSRIKNARNLHKCAYLPDTPLYHFHYTYSHEHACIFVGDVWGCSGCSLAFHTASSITPYNVRTCARDTSEFPARQQI